MLHVILSAVKVWLIVHMVQALVMTLMGNRHNNFIVHENSNKMLQLWYTFSRFLKFCGNINCSMATIFSFKTMRGAVQISIQIEYGNIYLYNICIIHSYH